MIADKAPWPPHAGDKVRLLQYLTNAPKHWETTVVAPAPPDEIEECSSELSKRGIEAHIVPGQPAVLSLRDCLRSWRRGRPLLCEKHKFAAVCTRADELLASRRVDAVLVYRLAAVQHVPWERTAQIPVFFDLVDANFPLVFEQRRGLPRWRSRVLSTIDGAVSCGYERRLCSRFASVFVSSWADAQSLAGVAGEVRVLPNAVHVDPMPAHLAGTERAGHLLLIGGWSYFPNLDAAQWLCREILPLVVARSDVPVNLKLVGPHPECLTHLSGDHVSICGVVEDLAPLMAEASVIPLPFRYGLGTRLKLLEAMAHGKGIVSTSRGIRDICVEHGKSALVADTAKGFADALCELLDNPRKRHALGANARSVAERDHDARRTTAELFGYIEASMERQWRQ